VNRKINKILIANRGVTAVRVMHTCRDRKIPTTAVYSTPDRLAHHVFMADTAVHIGEAPPAESYLNMEKMINAAIQSQSDAIHPGWGFLAENHKFAKMVIDAGLTWIGPPPEVINALGDKIQAKKLAQKANVPTIPGIIDVLNIEQIRKWMKTEKASFPIMIKAVAGGGGRGMVKVENKNQLGQAVAQARSEATIGYW
jgi:acetyl/propionyl-CoA carboxylase alpha subunit